LMARRLVDLIGTCEVKGIDLNSHNTFTHIKHEKWS
jgi:hypothetical protein